MNDTIDIPHITIHADQVHIHLPAPPALSPMQFTYPQPQPHTPPLETPYIPQRRSLFGRILRRTQQGSSSPQLAAQEVAQSRSGSLPQNYHPNATPTTTQRMNDNVTSCLDLTNLSSTAKNRQNALVTLTTALNQGGFVTLGQTVIRLNNPVTTPNEATAPGAIPPLDPLENVLSPPAESAPTERRKKPHPKSSELREHRFWLKGNMHAPLLQLQRNQFYEAGTIVHHTRLATLVHESVGSRQTLPMYIGLSLSEQSIVYTEHELRTLFRQACLAVKLLHHPARSSVSGGDNPMFPTAHRNLHMNHILVDPVTGQVSLRGFQHAVRLDQTVDPSSPSIHHSDDRGCEKDEHKVESFISSVTDTFTIDDPKRDAASASSRFYSTAPLVFDEPDGHNNATDAETMARRHRRRVKRRAYDWFAFRAPELSVEGSPHGTAVDIWSLGAALYVLLTGLPPFRGTGESLTMAKSSARIAPYDVTTEPSAGAQDLVRRMLVADPRRRLDITDVLSHEWLADESDHSVAEAMSCDLTLAQSCLQDWGRRS